MRAQDFVVNAEKISNENKLLRIVVPLLILVIFSMGMWMANINQTVVIIPPNMPKEAVVSINSANRDYKKAYAMFAASMIGNVDKKSAAVTNKGIIDLLDVSIKSSFEAILADQLSAIKKNNLRISFSPTSMAYEPETDKVFVTGNRVLYGTGGSKSENRTFEFIIEIKNYMPVITHIDVYKGAAKLGVTDEK
jgi:conjugal transfer pilus assembly protein TraE